MGSDWMWAREYHRLSMNCKDKKLKTIFFVVVSMHTPLLLSKISHQPSSSLHVSHFKVRWQIFRQSRRRAVVVVVCDEIVRKCDIVEVRTNVVAEKLFILASTNCFAVQCDEIVSCRLTHAAFSHDPILMAFSSLGADQITRMDTLDILCRVLWILGVNIVEADASHVTN